MGKKNVGGKGAKLIYFDLYGKAESIRMLLTHANVPFQDIRLSLSDRTEFIRMKESGELPGGQVPVFIEEDGRTLNQSSALLIYLAKKHGYYGKDEWSSYEDDWAMANFDDIW